MEAAFLNSRMKRAMAAMVSVSRHARRQDAVADAMGEDVFGAAGGEVAEGMLASAARRGRGFVELAEGGRGDDDEGSSSRGAPLGAPPGRGARPDAAADFLTMRRCVDAADGKSKSKIEEPIGTGRAINTGSACMEPNKTIQQYTHFSAIRLALLAIVAVLFLSTPVVFGAPVTQGQAAGVVASWRVSEKRPLNSTLGSKVLRVRTQNDADGKAALPCA